LENTNDRDAKHYINIDGDMNESTFDGSKAMVLLPPGCLYWLFHTECHENEMTAIWLELFPFVLFISVVRSKRYQDAAD